jgi:F0F1-type ATP synthase assembly protein I
MNNDGIATTSPVIMVANEGVLNLGWILEKALGNKPSLLILIQILGWPS